MGSGLSTAQRPEPRPAGAVAAAGSADLVLDQVTVVRRGRTVVESVSTVLRAGTFTAICGPNGAGKSTLLGVVGGTLAPRSGGVRIGGMDPFRTDRAVMARHRAVLSQSPALNLPFHVREVVALGRLPLAETPRRRDDAHIVETALETVGMAGMADRDYTSLSGGERQRTQIARVLAQLWDAPAAGVRPWLFLDEPVNALDPKHRVALMRVLAELAGRGWGVLCVFHDLGLVRRWAERCLLMAGGALVATGPVDAVLSDERMREIFEIDPRDLGAPWGTDRGVVAGREG